MAREARHFVDEPILQHFAYFGRATKITKFPINIYEHNAKLAAQAPKDLEVGAQNKHDFCKPATASEASGIQEGNTVGNHMSTIYFKKHTQNSCLSLKFSKFAERTRNFVIFVARPK